MESYYNDKPLKIKIINPLITGGTDFSFFDQKIDNIKKTKVISKVKGNLSSIGFYPNDNFVDVRHKIYVGYGIPIYRQHLIYFRGNKIPHNLYNLFIGMDILDINIMNMKTTESIAGISIDKLLSNAKTDIRVDMNDLNTFLYSQTDNKYVDTIIVVDLYSLLDPSNINIQKAIADEYQRNLLYYGFIIKYFPQIPYDGYINIYVKGDTIESLYPRLNPPFDKFNSKFKLQKDIMNDLIKNIPKINNKIDKLGSRNIYSVTSAIVTFEIPVINSRIFIDRMILNNEFVYIACPLLISNKIFLVSKQYGSYVGNILHNTRKLNTDVIYIQLQDNTKVFINKNIISIELKFFENDNITYKNINKFIFNIYNFITNKIKNTNELLVSGSHTDITTPIIASSTVSIMWPETMSTTNFINMRTYLDKFIKSGFIDIKQILPGTIEANIEHGVYNTIATKVDALYVSYSHITNQYDYYINDEYYKRINATNYKQVSFIQRVSDITISCLNISQYEFSQSKMLLIYIIYSYIHTIIKVDNINVTNTKKKINRLRNIDPNLFDLRRHDPNVDVYSIKCQSQRQPDIYRENELPKSIKDKVIPFWNFTDNKQIYYYCPNKKYPNLSFRPQDHPLGYCLPCCKKKESSDVSKQYQLDKECLLPPHIVSESKYNNIKDNILNTVKHILAYGKNIDVGRISYIPNILDKLLNDINKYRLVGVQQHLNLLPDAGIIYSITISLGISVETLILDFMKNITIDTFKILEISQVSTYKDLKNLFMNIIRGSGNIMIDLGSINWINLLSELLYLTYGLNIIIFNEVNLNYFNIEIIKTTEAAIITSEKMNKYLILFKNNNGIYPMMINDIFLLEIDNSFMSVVQKIIVDTSKLNTTLDLTRLIIFIKSNKDYKINKILQGKRGLIYAAYLLYKNKHYIYVPLVLTEFLSDEFDIEYNFPKTFSNINRSHVYMFIDDFNKFLSKLDKSLIPIAPDSHMKYKDKYIGLNIKINNDKFGLIFYYKDEKGPGRYGELDFIDMPYSIIDINKSIDNNIQYNSKESNNYTYLYNMYNLFLTEFIYYIKQFRNNTIRDSIYRNIKLNHINKKEIGEILKEYKNDYNYIMNIINTMPALKIIPFLKSVLFDFDLIELNKIRKLDIDARIKYINNIAHKFTSVNNKSNINMSNIYLSCKIDNSQLQCDNKKLMMSEKNLNKCIKFISTDIENNYIYETLITNVMGIINPLKFKRHPFEILKIEER